MPEPPSQTNPPSTSATGPLKILHQIEKTTEFSGPLPHPDVLAKYEAILPGATERIINMAVAEANHRRSMEVKMLESDIEYRRGSQNEVRIGQFCALIIGLVAICAATFAAVNGAIWFANVIGGGVLLSLVSAFLFKQRRPKQKSPPKDQN